MFWFRYALTMIEWLIGVFAIQYRLEIKARADEYDKYNGSDAQTNENRCGVVPSIEIVFESGEFRLDIENGRVVLKFLRQADHNFVRWHILYFRIKLIFF